MTATYDKIATYTAPSSQTAVTFNSFSGYTDLVLVCNIKNTSSTPRNVYLQFNGDTGNNYSKTLIEGNGSSASSARDTNSPAIYSAAITVGNTTDPALSIINIMNYANTTTYKTTLSRYSGASLVTNAVIGLWRNTAAITSLTLTIDTASNIATGSTFTLYGIKAE